MKKFLGIILAATGIMIIVLNLIVKIKRQMSVSILSGADGPTSIFVAGKVGGSSAIIEIIAGIALVATGIFMIVKKK